jgi:Transglutaminase-like superfamily
MTSRVNKSCQARRRSCNGRAMSAPVIRPRPGQRSLSDWLLLGEGLLALALASLAIALLPFRWVAAAASVRGRRPQRSDSETVRRVRGAIQGWSRRVPWRAVCFQRGLALHWMLRRRGIPSVLSYGARHEGDKLAAHVWIDVEGETVIGGEEAPSFACLARFPPDAV